MSPSEKQSGSDGAYASQVERQVHEWPTEWLKTINPVREERCRAYIGELNKLDETPVAVVEHFADRIEELQE
jgi:hypothetical protein